MIPAYLNPLALSEAQRQFENALPLIQRNLNYHFRRWPRRFRAEVLDDALAACWHAWIGIVRRGQDPILVGISAICFNASRYVKAGRRLGCGSSGRSRIDILDRQVQARFGLHVASLDRDNRWNKGAAADAWRERLIEDRRAGPAATAASRIDFADWLRQLPARKRSMAQLLASGEQTGSVARLLGVTSGAVSQTRTWLLENWRSFQAEANSDRGQG